ncbi:hypothetical protein MY11210_002939 [Beauveria gryllotalpidicola]
MKLVTVGPGAQTGGLAFGGLAWAALLEAVKPCQRELCLDGSKAFRDVAYKNLNDAGFPDRIKWMQAAARTRPWMDISRVGITGGSAGGQNAAAAVLHHSDFYKAAIALSQARTTTA